MTRYKSLYFPESISPYKIQGLALGNKLLNCPPSGLGLHIRKKMLNGLNIKSVDSGLGKPKS